MESSPKKHVQRLERVQRALTKYIPEFEGLEYEERLNKMNLPTLKERRVRGDILMIYKCLTNRENTENDKVFKFATSKRCHDKKLLKSGCSRDVEKYGFPNRSIELWNKLPDYITNQITVKGFKKSYDSWKAGPTRL